MNENDKLNVSFNEDSEDDDNQEYFLQATTNAYDIKEKIRAANNELFESYESYNNISREQKVTFRENLVDYEPDYSSDDGYVQSPEALTISDNENDIQHDYFHRYHPLAPVPELTPQDEEYTNPEEYHQNKTEFNCLNPDIKTNSEIQNVETNNSSPKLDTNQHFYIREINTIDIKTREYSCTFEQIEEEIEEEYITEDVEIIEITEDINDIENDLNETEINNTSPEDKYFTTDNHEETSATGTKNKNNKKHCKTVKPEIINCRLHCLEKRDLDIISENMKNIMNINKGPTLKLRPRICCQNQPYKPKLPTYNGLVSEYGMSKAQLDRRQRRKVRNAQRNKEKSIKILEEKKQKDMYNEEIFCAWLKSVRQRNQNYQKSKNTPLPKKQRPKTANDIYNNTNYKTKCKTNRPNTSPCKGYVATIYVSPGVKVKEILNFNK